MALTNAHAQVIISAILQRHLMLMIISLVSIPSGYAVLLITDFYEKIHLAHLHLIKTYWVCEDELTFSMASKGSCGQ